MLCIDVLLSGLELDERLTHSVALALQSRTQEGQFSSCREVRCLHNLPCSLS